MLLQLPGRKRRLRPPREPHCEDFDDNQKICTKCKSLFWNPSAGCVPIDDPNCLKSDGKNNKCDVYASGFYPNLDCPDSPRKCVKQFVEHCKAYLCNTNTCLECDCNDFVLVNNQCQPSKEKNYADFDYENNVCNRCISHFWNPQRGCRPISDQNCGHSDGIYNSCDFCLTDFYPDEAGWCQTQSVPFFLRHFRNQNRCQHCQDNYELQNDDICGLSIPNCVGFNSQGRNCDQCDSGLLPVLRGSQCDPISVPNCGQSGGQEDLCDECEEGFTHGIDEEGKPSCLPLNVPKCSKRSSSGRGCAECENGLKLYKGFCVEEVEYCTAYDSETKLCSECEEPFSLNAQFTCEFTDSNCEEFDKGKRECTRCKSLFYIANRGRSCRAISHKLCESSNGRENKCDRCHPSAVLSLGPDDQLVCTPQSMNGCNKFKTGTNECDECDDDHTPKNGKCQKKIPNCKSYHDKTLECTECENEKFLVNGLCQDDIPNCDLKSNDKKKGCDGCKEGWYANPGKGCARQSIPRCDKYETNQNKCQICDAGYGVDKDSRCV